MKRTSLACASAVLLLVGGCSSTSTATAPAWTPTEAPTPTITPSSPAPSVSPTETASPTASPSSASASPGADSASPSPSGSASHSPSGSATPAASAAPRAATDAGSVGTMPSGFRLPGGLRADNTLQNLDPCLTVTGKTDALAQRSASRFSRTANARAFTGNGGIVFASEDAARAFMRDAIAKSDACRTTRTRTGVGLLASRTAPTNAAWDRSVFTASQVPNASANGQPWGQGTLIVRKGQYVAVYNKAGMTDRAPAGPSKEAVAQVTEILKGLAS
ncbi:hypothetical protein [Nigerium sp.]|uniref:hypothetical protein n=1 Tax=Nigerium sp. TaxID=2042655 RepID=UPI0032213D14